MKVIKEDIANLERCIENDKVNIVGSMPITMADAFYDSQKKQKQIDDAMEETIEENKDEKVIGAKKQPVPKKPEEPKATLEESLFEDYDPDIRHYSDMLFDMIDEGAVDAAEIAKDLIYWCSEDDIKHYMRVNNLTSELMDDEDYEENLNESSNLQNERIKNVKSYLEKALNTINTYLDRIDESLNEATEKDRYYAALDIPKGPERKKVAAERRKEFLQKHGLTDRAQEWKDAKDKDNPKENIDLFSLINQELVCENPYFISKTKFPDIKAKQRYNNSDIGIDYKKDGFVDITVRQSSEDKLDFAKKVANAYNAEIIGPVPDGNNYILSIRIPD